MSILVVAIKKLQQQRVFVTKKELFFLNLLPNKPKFS